MSKGKIKTKRDPKIYCSHEDCIREADWATLPTPWSTMHRYLCQEHYEAIKGRFHSAYKLDIRCPKLKRPEELEFI